MKTQKFYPLFFVAVLVLSACKTAATTEVPEKFNIESGYSGLAFEISVQQGKAHNHPTFAIWIEDMEGNYLKTLFITRSYATGEYGYAALTDTTWSNKPGESYRPAALPYWTNKKGQIAPGELVPRKKYPYLDAFTGATPKGDFSVQTKLPVAKKVRLLLEVNQTWDWNRHWTNNKYPGDRDYKSSAQPSIIYAVTIDVDDPMLMYRLNPIGHGHYSGLDGRLYTDLSTMTTALEIFESITVKPVKTLEK